MIRQLGILVDDLRLSQSNYHLIHSLNNIISKRKDYDVAVFLRNFAAPPVTPMFGVFQTRESYTYQGVLIATNLDSAKTLIDISACLGKYFYLQNLEWTLYKKFAHKTLSDIYNNGELELIVRSMPHHNIVRTCWKTPHKLIKDWDSDSLIQLVETDYERN